MSIIINPICSLIPAADGRDLPYGWGTLTFLADATSGTSPLVSMARVVLKAGARNMRHRHPNCDELLYLIRGRLQHSVGADEYPMGPGDTIRIAKDIEHHAQVLGDEDAEMLVVYSAGDRETVVID